MDEYPAEFRHLVDDAWYSVRTVFDGETLTVKYKDFTQDEDTAFDPQSFTSLPDLDAFQRRFRPLSVQVQDNECYTVRSGTVVCASHSFTADDVCFYDAVVEEVKHKPHRVSGDGEEVCACDFLIVWKHGPRLDCFDSKKVDDICLVQSNVVLDSKLEAFLCLVKQKLSAPSSPKTLSLTMKPKFTVAQKFFQGRKCAKRSFPGKMHPSEEIERSSKYTESMGEGCDAGENHNHCIGMMGEDDDFGQNHNLLGLLVDNLDKDLSPSAIVEFIHRQTSLSVQAYVFPNLPYETYTKGAIILDGQRSFEELSNFLGSPNHIVVSHNGRPWIVSGKLSKLNPFMGSLGRLIFKHQNKLQHRSLGFNNELKLLCAGSEEYMTAKRLGDLFMEFVDHQRVLHRSLALEEGQILQ